MFMAVQMTALTLETDWHNYFFFIFNLSYEKCEKLKKNKSCAAIGHFTIYSYKIPVLQKTCDKTKLLKCS